MRSFNRRDVLKFLGIGAAAAAAGGTAKVAEAAVSGAPGESTGTFTPDSREPWWLIAPYGPEAKVAGSTVKGITADTTGLVRVELEAADGRVFHVDVCRRDSGLGAPKSVAATKHYELYLANGGKGSNATVEADGFALYGLADAIDKNELNATLHKSLLTMRQRWAAFGS